MPSDVVSRVLENRSLGGGYFLTTFEAAGIASTCSPGQFVMAGSTDAAELFFRRPYSICLRNRDDSGRFEMIDLLYRVVGRGTQYLSRLGPGDRSSLLGPLGRGFTAPRDGETPVIVAGGVGIAAFPFLIEELLASGHKPVLLYGARTSRDLPMLEWFQQRVSLLEITTEDGSLGESGLVTDPLERRLGAGAGHRSIDRIYVCGPHAMMKAVAEIAARRNAPCEVALEAPMACGYGVCVGCVIEVNRFEGEYGRYRRVCADGPVFDASEVRW